MSGIINRLLRLLGVCVISWCRVCMFCFMRCVMLFGFW